MSIEKIKKITVRFRDFIKIVALFGASLILQRRIKNRYHRGSRKPLVSGEGAKCDAGSSVVEEAGETAAVAESNNAISDLAETRGGHSAIIEGLQPTPNPADNVTQ